MTTAPECLAISFSETCRGNNSGPTSPRVMAFMMAGRKTVPLVKRSRRVSVVQKHADPDPQGVVGTSAESAAVLLRFTRTPSAVSVSGMLTRRAAMKDKTTIRTNLWRLCHGPRQTERCAHIIVPGAVLKGQSQCGESSYRARSGANVLRYRLQETGRAGEPRSRQASRM